MHQTEIDLSADNETREEAIRRAVHALPSQETLYDLSDLFKMFGDSTRLGILLALSEGEVCVFELASILSMTQSAISHQLRVLKSSKLVKNRRQGKLILYSLADDHVRDIIAQGMSHIQE